MATNKEVSILETLLMPAAARAQERFCDPNSADPTAIYQVVQAFPKQWQGQPSNSALAQLPAGEMLLILFRDDPLRHYIIYDPNSNSSTWTYKWSDNGDYDLPVDNGEVHVTRAVAQTSYRPHTQNLFSGQDSHAYRYIWGDGVNLQTSDGTIITVTMPITPTSESTGEIQIWAYNNGDPVCQPNIDNPSGSYAVSFGTGSTGGPTYPLRAQTTYTFYLLKSDYIHVSLAGGIETGIINGGVQVSVSGKCSVFCHNPVETFWQNVYRFGGIRIVGQDGDIKDMSSDLNNQGTTAACKTREPTAWYEILEVGVGGSVLAEVADYGSVYDRYLGKFKNGCHAANLPCSESWYKMRNFVQVDEANQIVLDSVFNLCPLNPPVLIAVNSINPGGTNVITGCDSFVTIGTIFETRTSNKMEGVGYAESSPVEWILALWKARYAPVATVNDTHIDKILGFISDAMHWLRPAANALSSKHLTPAQAGIAMAAYDAGAKAAGKRKRKT